MLRNTAAQPPQVIDITLTVAHVLIGSTKSMTAGVASANVSALTEGVLQTMFVNKLRTLAAGVLAACLVLTGFGWLVHDVLGDEVDIKAPVPAGTGTKAELTAQNFMAVHTTIKPGKGEFLWDKVPWYFDLTAARKKAAAEDKPILIFTTGGAGFNDGTGLC
jgi:hypothetical protein